MDSLSSVNAFTVFLAIALIGFLFLLVALIFGEIFDFFDHDVDFDHGGPGILSSRVIAVFITAFGAFGAIATRNGLGPGPASAVGLGSGVVFGAIIYAFLRFLYGQQVTSEVLASDLVGQNARVVVAIPANGVGQVRCRIGEELVDKIAQARDGVAIAENTPVRIEEVLGETVIVKRAESQVSHV
jgi:membrane protein implicated in regulation of membrane protease activity